MGTGGRDGAVVVGPHGAAVTYARGGAAPRRVGERDRHGTDLAELTWHDDLLAAARLRMPDGSWLAIEPRATREAPWGLSDRVWHAGTPLTVFAAVDYGRIASIPPLAEPGRLPPGAGTTILNLLAALAADQGAGALPYAGPYPTESLFLALLESFRYVPAGPGDPARDSPEAAEPLRAFLEGALVWAPSPHTRVFARDGACIQLRDGVEKVVWRGRTYHRGRWQDVERRTPRRVRDVDDRVVCSLWALDRPIEDHLALTPSGDVLAVVAPPAPALAAMPVPPAVAAAVVAIVAARSAPALAPMIREAGLELEWGPIEHDLLTIDERRARVSIRIAPAAAELLAAASTRAARAGAALTILAELATLLGDPLRARAQASLLALDPDTQRRALATAPSDPSADAPVIAHAVEILLSDPAILPTP